MFRLFASGTITLESTTPAPAPVRRA